VTGKRLSTHQRIALAAQRAREASDRLGAVSAAKGDLRPIAEVVQDVLWAAGCIDTWVGRWRGGVATIMAMDREMQPLPLREDQQEEILDAVERALGDAGGWRWGRGVTSTGLSCVRVAKIAAENSLF
jgi:hypothetical protein